jgi:hypothetical protein
MTSATSQAFIRAADPVKMVSVAAQTEAANPAKALSRLRAVVLLGGSVRQTQLTQETGRSILDLPVESGTHNTILNLWLSHAAELAEYAGLENLPVQALVSRNLPEPSSSAARYRNSFKVLRDQSEFRGTGGVLRDLAHDYNADDLVLVANAAQLLLDPLSVIAAALDHKRSDIALISHQDGTPSGVMLVRCQTLRVIPTGGFVDMKEQALPMIAQQFDVRVMHLRRPSGLPIRTLADYIGALRHYHRLRHGRPALVDPLSEDWQPAFSIVEDGATVHPGAAVHDSVVMRGAVIESGAALVRSLACPGAVAKARTTHVEKYISSGVSVRRSA